MTVTLISSALASLRNILLQSQNRNPSSGNSSSQPLTKNKKRNGLPSLVSVRAFSDALNHPPLHQMPWLMHARKTKAITKPIEADTTEVDYRATGKKEKKGAKSVDYVRAYLQEIGRIPMLSHDEEILYGKQVQEMMKLIEIKENLEEKIERVASNSEWLEAINLEIDETTLLQKIGAGTRAKRKMIEANLRLVVSVAKKYQKRNVELLDLIQEGTLGLERAVEKFDPTKGYKFSTYSYWWIRQAITRAIAQQGRTIRLPVHITEKINKIKKAQRELSQVSGRAPTVAEIAHELKMKTDALRQLLEDGRTPLSLDMKLGDGRDDAPLENIIDSKRETPNNYVVKESLRDDIHSLVATLPEKQRQVMILRYGLEDGIENSLASIATQMNLSREQVRQLEKQAMATLRERQEKLKEYLEV